MKGTVSAAGTMCTRRGCPGGAHQERVAGCRPRPHPHASWARPDTAQKRRRIRRRRTLCSRCALLRQGRIVTVGSGSGPRVHSSELVERSIRRRAIRLRCGRVGAVDYERTAEGPRRGRTSRDGVCLVTACIFTHERNPLFKRYATDTRVLDAARAGHLPLARERNGGGAGEARRGPCQQVRPRRLRQSAPRPPLRAGRA